MKRKRILVPLFLFFLAFIFNETTAQDTTGTALIQKKFEKKLKKRKAVLLDVRTADEFKEGFIGNAVNYNVLDSTSFVRSIAELDKKKTYLLYCKSGRRSGKALTIMKENGFPKVYHLQGGITAWTGETKKPE